MSHYPPEKIAFHMRTPTWSVDRPQVGPACAAVIADLLTVNALFGYAAPGMLGLGRHPRTRLEPPSPRRSPSATRPTAPSRPS